MDPAYFLHIAGGELRSLSRAQSIERVLAKGTLTTDQAHKLKLVQQVRIYAHNCLKMKIGNAYTTFEDNAGGHIAYAVSGARRDRLEPYEWKYPIIGEYEAKGFFDRKLAEKEAKRLMRKNYDVFISEIAGFSTMGVFPDPVRSSNLEDDDVDLAILIFHELTHNTVFKSNDTQFNESMATFVGRTAAVQFFRDSFGEDSPQAAAVARRLADLKVIDSYVSDVYQRLEIFYCRPIASQDKIAGRETILADQRDRFARDFAPLLHEPDRYAGIVDVMKDNASVLAAYRYHSNLGVYAETHTKLGNDLRATIALLKRAARERDSHAFLEIASR